MIKELDFQREKELILGERERRDIDLILDEGEFPIR